MDLAIYRKLRNRIAGTLWDWNTLRVVHPQLHRVMFDYADSVLSACGIDTAKHYVPSVRTLKEWGA